MQQPGRGTCRLPHDQGDAVFWNVDGLPVEVQLAPEVLNDLHQALANSATEFGGILLGRVDQADGKIRTTVEAFRPFPIEHRYGVGYSLSETDRRQLRKRLRGFARRELLPVGMCRSHERRGLYMDQRDFEVFQQQFRNPASVFLVVRRMDGAGTRGGIFVWEGDDIRRHASYREFSLGEIRQAPRPQPVEPWFRVPDFRRYVPDFRNSPLLIALAGATILLPLTSFYTARAIASREKSAPAVAQTPAAAPQASAHPATQAVATRGSLAQPNPAARSVSAGSRDREAPEPAPPALPKPPRAFEPVVAYIKPAPASLMRRALDRLSGSHDDAAFVAARPVEYPLPALPRAEAPPDGDSDVEVRAHIGPGGEVTDMKTLRGDVRLARLSETALARWKFEPARSNGEAVESDMLVRFVFRTLSR